MQFIRNILIIGNTEQLNQELEVSIKHITNKVKVKIVKDKSSVSTALQDNKINSVFMALSEYSDSMYVLKLLAMYKTKTNEKLSIFFSSPNFETFQMIINNTDFDGVEVSPWPIDVDGLSQKMVDTVFEKKMSKQVITKKNKKVAVDLEFIQVFVQATKKTLEEMGQVTGLVHQKPTYLNLMPKPIDAGISSKIMIHSEYFTGNFYVIFPEAAFLKLYESAVMEECDEINEENQDFAAELANIIYGQSKKVLSASGLNLDMAIPSIHTSTKIEGDTVIIIPFESSIGEFYIAVAPGTL